ncbi:MAG: hypothetical protein WDW38_010351 [Sanguina aurantia]
MSPSIKPSQLGSSSPAALTTSQELHFSIFARHSGSDTIATPRSDKLPESHSLQQQLKRLFAPSLGGSSNHRLAVDASEESPLLALPEALLHAVVGFVLQERDTTHSIGFTSSEAAGLACAHRATDLRALRASCRALRVLADRRIGSLEVTWPMIMTLNSKSHRTHPSSDARSQRGILGACCFAQPSVLGPQDPTSNAHTDGGASHTDTSHRDTSHGHRERTPSGNPGPNLRLQKSNSGPQTPGTPGSRSLQYANPTFQTAGSQQLPPTDCDEASGHNSQQHHHQQQQAVLAGGVGMGAGVRDGAWEGSGRHRFWRDISDHFSQVHTLRLPNFQNVSWDQISAMEGFVKQVFPTLQHLRSLLFPGNLRRWGLPFIRQEHREASRRLVSALHCASPQLQRVGMDPRSSNDARFFLSGPDLARLPGLREIRVATLGKRGSLNELRW